MIFNPYDWSTVVNICLILVLLVSYSLFELSTEKFSWDDWHRWMKTNTDAEEMERKLMIKFQTTDSGKIKIQKRDSEEVNRQCCSCIPRFLYLPVIFLVTAVLGLWPAGNI